MMRWWLDRGVDGFRMDVINMISKDLAAGVFLRGRGSTSSWPRCAARSSTGTRNPLTVGRDARGGPRPGVLFTDPARRQVDMVFQFEHVAWTRARTSGTCARSTAALKASLGRWQAGAGRGRLEQPVLEQPRPAAGGLPVRLDDSEHRVAAAKLLATVLHLHRGTPYVYQGEELGMTNAPFTGLTDFRDIESLNYHTAAVAAGPPTRTRCWPRCAR